MLLKTENDYNTIGRGVTFDRSSFFPILRTELVSIQMGCPLIIIVIGIDVFVAAVQSIVKHLDETLTSNFIQKRLNAREKQDLAWEECSDNVSQ
jgi:hypothetical protein